MGLIIFAQVCMGDRPNYLGGHANAVAVRVILDFTKISTENGVAFCEKRRGGLVSRVNWDVRGYRENFIVVVLSRKVPICIGGAVVINNKSLGTRVDAKVKQLQLLQ